MTNGCIFCKIVKEEAPADVIYKDRDMVVFHNIKPSAPVHALMVPLEHIESINTLTEKHGAIIAKMMIKAKDVARSLGIHDSGYKLVINVGKGGGQAIFHLHIHLVGGWKDGDSEHFV